MNKQKIAATFLFTKYSIVNPMAPFTTALESCSNPVLRRSTFSQRPVPVLAAVPVPVKGQEARSSDLALQGTVQTSYSAVRTEYASPNPLEGPAQHVPAVTTETVEWCAPAVLRLA
jgi:hypothetical protein